MPFEEGGLCTRLDDVGSRHENGGSWRRAERWKFGGRAEAESARVTRPTAQIAWRGEAEQCDEMEGIRWSRAGQRWGDIGVATAGEDEGYGGEWRKTEWVERVMF